ncbi:hypothetical protein OAQ99_01875 [Candidatus Kapabacteria bacterium]|nr:hypothetical protein [Candidatus Kapabacteria bacterium]
MFSNNVFIENQNVRNNGYEKYFAGSSVLTINSNSKKVFSNAINTNQNSDYTLFIFQLDSRIFSILSEDVSTNRLRIFNISNEEILIRTNNQEYSISGLTYLNIQLPGNSGRLILNENQKEVSFQNFSETKINNISVDSELDIEYFQSF